MLKIVEPQSHDVHFSRFRDIGREDRMMESTSAFTPQNQKEGFSTKPNYQFKDKQVSMIRKELIALTGNHFRAIVLNQLLYWTLRVKDFDLLLEEEKTLDQENIPQYGWVYKTSNDLIKETLLRINRTTMRRHLSFLIQMGWVYERANPTNRWDKTTQYRINLRKIQNDLLVLGYSLPEVYLQEALFGEGLSKTAENLNIQNAPSKVYNSHSKVQNTPSNVRNCTFIYLTETTTKNTNKEHTLSARENALLMIELWKKHIGQDEVHLTKKRKAKFTSLLSLHFQNDPSKWEAFCKRIKASSFLMGEGPKKWHISFDWILREDNLLKVLEGNFDNPEEIQQRKESKAKIIRQKKTQEILESIQDPYWREWCSQLSEFPPDGYFQVNKPFYWWQLERIANAKFLDFDGRLVVIGSSDPKVLDQIEENRYQLASIIARTFPTSRTIRTELLKEEVKAPTKLKVQSQSSSLKSCGSPTQQEGKNYAE